MTGLLTRVKPAVRRLTPARLLLARRRRIAHRAQRPFADMTNAERFAAIYARGAWGGGSDLYSGLGSHDETVVGPYVDAVRTFLADFATPPDVVDLGCGDFAVGSRLRDACGSYVGCDVAGNVIERNRVRFAALDVDFRTLDMVEEPLPEGEVVFVRQVLQHLGNGQIISVLPKLRAYRWAVVTEHLPTVDDFVANLDIAPGPGIRAAIASGVVLDEPPFSFEALRSQVLCRVRHPEGTIVTIAYQLAGADRT